jgi:hypothetical protein
MKSLDRHSGLRREFTQHFRGKSAMRGQATIAFECFESLLGRRTHMAVGLQNKTQFDESTLGAEDGFVRFRGRGVLRAASRIFQ